MNKPSIETSVIKNGEPWHDTRGREIFCGGGQITRYKSIFYWAGYDTQSPWSIVLYSSGNLSEWKFEGKIVKQEGVFSSFEWAGRPALLFDKTGKKWVLFFEAEIPGKWERHKIGVAISENIHGPYKLHSCEFAEKGRSTGDQSVYNEEEDAYLLATMDKRFDGELFYNQSLAIFRLNPGYLGVGGKIFEGFENTAEKNGKLPRHHTSREAPCIIRRKGIYYWFSSALVGWKSSGTMYATARSLAGPWSSLKPLKTRPFSRDSFNTQVDFILPVEGDRVTTFVYTGDRWSQFTGRGKGRNIFLPLIWKNDEPHIRWMRNWKINARTGLFSEIR